MRIGHESGRLEVGDVDQEELAAKIDHARKNVLGCIHDVERAGNDGDRTKAREGLKSAFNQYFDLLWQQFNFQSLMAHQRAGAESRSAEDHHEHEIFEMANVDFDERYEDTKERTRDESAWKTLEAEYEKTLRAWEAHVQQLFADRLTVIRAEKSGHAERAQNYQTDVLTSQVQGDALALYLDGMIQQALASGDPITVSAPSTSAVGGASLIDALLSRLGTADDEGRKPRSMEPGDFNQMLDHLFS